MSGRAPKRARGGSAAAGGAGGGVASDPLFDEAAFDALAADMAAEDAKRDKIIKRSRDVLKLSKTSIYALHRGDMAKAAKQLDEARQITKDELFPLAEGGPAFLRGGALSSALEEYAEARVFETFLTTGSIPTLADLEICDRDEYVGGVLDFTGELNRYAVLRATDRDVEAVRHCRELTDQLMAAFMKFEFRNGNLRKKYDSLKYTLKKMETLIYEMSLSAAMGGLAPKSSEGDKDMPDGADDADLAAARAASDCPAVLHVVKHARA
eukprot:CAMPEP_0203815932 /NCGR_PEP_ID=MMETSP0115-20131106/13525_1 /ASSEMBLY_ACC=CAM_ASM_000227 /TAXON_ID=33651 /ORGANISM="Bicosoecid sp, Strain ms1" /LENGTH=266 /DNA_ID=CAMNT_0050724831 /DNA_START=88 /DNA_END=886 /DNA_ORIENTATION=+